MQKTQDNSYFSNHCFKKYVINKKNKDPVIAGGKSSTWLATRAKSKKKK